MNSNSLTFQRYLARCYSSPLPSNKIAVKQDMNCSVLGVSFSALEVNQPIRPEGSKSVSSTKIINIGIICKPGFKYYPFTAYISNKKAMGLST